MIKSIIFINLYLTENIGIMFNLLNNNELNLVVEFHFGDKKRISCVYVFLSRLIYVILMVTLLKGVTYRYGLFGHPVVFAVTALLIFFT